MNDYSEPVIHTSTVVPKPKPEPKPVVPKVNLKDVLKNIESLETLIFKTSGGHRWNTCRDLIAQLRKLIKQL